MAINLYLALAIGIGVLVLGIVSVIAIRRYMKAYIIRIQADYSNPNITRGIYYALYDKSIDGFNLYRTLLSWNTFKVVPFANLAAYAYDGKHVDAIMSYTGKTNDNMLIFLHHATPSRIGIENWLSTARNGLVDRLQKGGKVTSDKITIEVDEKGRKHEKHTIVEEEVPGTLLTEEQKKALAKLVNLEWFAQINGFLPVENIGTLTEEQRQAAKHFYKQSYDKQKQGEGILAKMVIWIGAAIYMFVIALGAVLYWNSFFGNLNAYCGGGYCPVYTTNALQGAGSTLPPPSSTTPGNAVLHTNLTKVVTTGAIT